MVEEPALHQRCRHPVPGDGYGQVLQPCDRQGK